MEVKMNKYIVFFSFLIFISACEGFRQKSTSDIREKKSDNLVSSASAPEITFESIEHDFGKVHAGEKLGWYFKYKNTGSEPLVISSASASCGCTVADYPKEPLAPGKEGMIKIVFDTSGRAGRQTKTVVLETNAVKSKVSLLIRAEII